MKAIISAAYFGNIDLWIALALAENYLIEKEENFVKQSYRNRCYIYGPNGVQKLIIPLEKRNERTKFKDVNISSTENWTKIHWKSLEAAYRKSPYFEYYEDELKPLFDHPDSNLFSHDIKTMQWIADILELDLNLDFTSEYEKQYADYIDFRSKIHPKEKAFFKQEKYLQTFQERNGFIENLSILDLMFNLGPQTRAYLTKQAQ